MHQLHGCHFFPFTLGKCFLNKTFIFTQLHAFEILTVYRYDNLEFEYEKDGVNVGISNSMQAINFVLNEKENVNIMNT